MSNIFYLLDGDCSNCADGTCGPECNKTAAPADGEGTPAPEAEMPAEDADDTSSDDATNM